MTPEERKADKTYAMTLRIPMSLYKQVELMARAEDKPVSEVIREAIAQHIERRGADPAFQALLRQRMKEDTVTLKRLESGAS